MTGSTAPSAPAVRDNRLWRAQMIGRIHVVGMRKWRPVMDDQRFGEIHVERLPSMHVAGYRAIGDAPEDDASVRMARWREEHRLSRECRHFGFDTEVPADAAAFGLRGYEVWTTIPDWVTDSDEDVTITDLPGGSYAVLTIRDALEDPFTLIPTGWERLHDWVDTDPWVRTDDRQPLEELIERDGHRDLVLLYPVR
jgi:DNA gyrase inhibitor GyrI